MTQHKIDEPPRIFPTYRYRNASAMIDWLVEIFGFAVQAKYMDRGKVAHAQLAFGTSMIMLGDVKPDSYGKIIGDPGQPGGKSTYLAVEDVDALYARAKAAGATIEEPPTDRTYGSREFICRDPEGNVWCFGTYWPKAVDPSH